ncbi:MAG: glycosyl transferase family 2 [Phycisphaerales bacterium]|nr:glycosyl transferase family 2 [Phycisphaerales bacterium]
MSLTERILFGLYVLCGPVAWVVIAYFIAIGRERMNKLKKNRDPLPAEPPLVSILVPAKDEGPRIGSCLQAVLGQEYPAFEVIAINDRSTDDTGAVLDTFINNAAGKTAVRVVHIESLPAGWMGKCHALDNGARHARGEWLFFVDSDVRLSPDALSRMAALCIAREYDALSITTTIETHAFVEKLMLPLLAATWMTMFAGDQTNEDSELERAVANGQAFLIRRSAYEKVGGHAAVKDRIVEDVELMRTLKLAGFRTRFLAGRELAATRMHTHLKQMFNGWARIFAGTARGHIWQMVLAIGFLVCCVLSLFPALAMVVHLGEVTSFSWSGTPGSSVIMTTAHASVGLSPYASYWLFAALAHWLLMMILAGLVWFWTGNSPLYALLLPISVPVVIAILIYSIRKAISGKIDWRGSAVDVRQTSRAAKPPA